MDEHSGRAPRKASVRLVMALMAAVIGGACPSEKIEVADAPAMTRSPAVERTVGPADGRTKVEGMVLTVLTREGNNAPAGLRDFLGSVRVSLSEMDGDSPLAEVDLPLGGSGILVAQGADGQGRLTVQLLDPHREPISQNEIGVSSLDGMIGVLALEVGPVPETRGCLRCSDPAQLIDLPPVQGTVVFFSAHGRQFDGATDALHLAIREGVSPEARQCLLDMAGAQHLETGTAEPANVPDVQGCPERGRWAAGTGEGWAAGTGEGWAAGTGEGWAAGVETDVPPWIWMSIVPGPGVEPMEMARFLARRPEVKGMEVYEREGSGRFWVPLERPLDHRWGR